MYYVILLYNSSIFINLTAYNSYYHSNNSICFYVVYNISTNIIMVNKLIYFYLSQKKPHNKRKNNV